MKKQSVSIPVPIATRCSFCRATEAQRKKIIAGPSGLNICNECVSICNDLLDDGEPVDTSVYESGLLNKMDEIARAPISNGPDSLLEIVSDPSDLDGLIVTHNITTSYRYKPKEPDTE